MKIHTFIKFNKYLYSINRIFNYIILVNFFIFDEYNNQYDI